MSSLNKTKRKYLDIDGDFIKYNVATHKCMIQEIFVMGKNIVKCHCLAQGNNFRFTFSISNIAYHQYELLDENKLVAILRQRLEKTFKSELVDSTEVTVGYESVNTECDDVLVGRMYLKSQNITEMCIYIVNYIISTISFCEIIFDND